jgi:phytoene/squalene synthetase
MRTFPEPVRQELRALYAAVARAERAVAEAERAAGRSEKVGTPWAEKKAKEGVELSYRDALSELARRRGVRSGPYSGSQGS